MQKPMASITWHEVPFVRLCVPFVIGILTEQAVGGPWVYRAGFAFALVTLVLQASLSSLRAKRLLRFLAVTSLCFALGALVRESVEPDTEVIQRAVAHQDSYKAIVTNTDKASYGYKVELELIYPASRIPVTTIAYLRDPSIKIAPGDSLSFSGQLEEMRAPENPFAFDVGNYYSRKGIYTRCFLDSADILVIHPFHGGLNIMHWCAGIREHIKGIIHTYLRQEQSQAVLLAMTIGVEDYLDDSIYDAYAKSGAIHVLSISGLHVGIVSILLFLLVGRAKPTDKIWVKALRISVLLCGIWSFACIAGLSPSITRAAMMFSIYLGGIVIQRPVRGLNVLACTACICLCINPYQINSVSFQFSYLALLGILVFFKPIYGIVTVKTAVGKYAWGTVAMSASAQILLLPLLIYYFHQVSVVSLFSSLVVVPASYGILCGGIAMFAVHFFIPSLAELLGVILDHGIGITNHLVIMMSEIPFSYFSNIYLSAPEIYALAFSGVLLGIQLLTRRAQWRYGVAFCISAFGILHVISALAHPHQEVFAVYPSKESVSVDYVNGTTCQTNFELLSMPKYLADEVKNFRSASGIRSYVLMQDDTTSMRSAIQLIRIPHSGGDQNSSYRIAVVAAPIKTFETTLPGLDAKWIVLAPGLPYYFRNAVKEFCVTHDLSFHDMREQGSLYLQKHKNNNAYEKLQKRRQS